MKHNTLRRLLGNQRGNVLIMTAAAIVGLFSFTVLAIDGAMLLTTRNQLQAAADAAALAGASGLAEGSQNTATARAIDFASFNQATQDVRRAVNITANDVSFPQADIVRVRTHRTMATNDPLRTFFMRIVDLGSNNLSDVTAVAAARWFDVCEAACIKPWAIPDRWDDTDGNGAMDPGELYDKDITGYNVPNDVGLSVTLKVGNPNATMASGQFFAVALPPIDCPCGVEPQKGGAEYRWNIANCNPYPISEGDRLALEPGNMVGPTRQGMQSLLDADPGAYWSDSNQTVMGSRFGTSPRIALVPFFDPNIPPQSGREEVVIVKLGAFFLESVGPGSQVQGRFIKLSVQGTPCAGNGNSFLTGIALVE